MDREKNIKKISEILDNKIAKDIENSIYKFSKEYTEMNDLPYLLESIYSDKFNEIFNLLINKKSTFLIKALKDKKINASNIAFMRPDELNPEKYDTIIKKKELEENKKKNQATSNTHKCPKCKESKSTVIQKQTRSADEPATIYIECKTCGHTVVHDDS
jgi:DNA-directed RNA polymerase subunit M/transcription elongation factor TFIIS